MEHLVIADLFDTLLQALENGKQDELRLHNHLTQHKQINKDPEWHKRLDEVTTTELPEAMGKLFSVLDLQNTFIAVGRYIRSFEDAYFVIQNMEMQIKQSLIGQQLTEDFKPIKEVIFICGEMRHIVAGLIVDPLGRVYPEPITP